MQVKICYDVEAKLQIPIKVLASKHNTIIFLDFIMPDEDS